MNLFKKSFVLFVSFAYFCVNAFSVTIENVRKYDGKSFIGYEVERRRSTTGCYNELIGPTYWYFYDFYDYPEIRTSVYENNRSQSKRYRFMKVSDYFNIKWKLRFFSVFDSSDRSEMNTATEHYFRTLNENDYTVLYCDISGKDIYTKDRVFAYQNYDKNGHLKHLKVDNDIEIWLTNYPNGNIHSYIDSFGYEYKFNENKQPTYIKYPKVRREIIKYNPNGLEVYRKFKDGSAYINIYDNENKLIKRIWNDGATTFYEYNDINRLSHEYTEYKNCRDKLNEIEYSYEIKPEVGKSKVNTIEKHIGDFTYVTFKEEYSDNSSGNPDYTKYQTVEKITVTPETVDKLPSDASFLKYENCLYNYNLIVDEENIYLLPEEREQEHGYVYRDGLFLEVLLPFYRKTDNSFLCQKSGDYFLVGKRVFYKSFDDEILLDYAHLSKFYEQMGNQINLYRTAIENQHLVVPKGLICSDLKNDVICGLELDGETIVKFIPQEEIQNWLETQSGNYSYETYTKYGQQKRRIIKDGKLLPYSNQYVGSINNQFHIYKTKNNSFMIYNDKGIVEEYFTVPESISNNANYAFDANGKMYGIVPPEYNTETYNREEDSYTVYSIVPYSHGEILSFTGHLKNFGFLSKDDVYLQKYPSNSSAVFGNFGKDTAFKIIGKTSVSETIDDETGIWYKVRLADGTEGYFFGAFVQMFE